MRFKPGHRLRFFTADGVEITVNPFFFTNANDRGLQYELVTESGVRLYCVDDL